MKLKLLGIWLAVVAALAAIVAWFKRDAGEQNDETKKRGEALRVKVAEVKAEQAARKEATDAAVAQVDAAVRVDEVRDPVDVANQLLADAGKK